MLEAASLAIPFLLLLFIGTAGYIGSARYFSRIPSATPAAAPSGQSETQHPSDLNRHRVGSILFVPWTGTSTCEQRRFDNLTGRIVSDGVVDCEFPPPQEGGNTQLRLSDEQVVDGHARMRAILEAFKK